MAFARVASVTVAELEPVIVRWYREHPREAARRAEAAERAGRARIATADVAVLLGEAGRRGKRGRECRQRRASNHLDPPRSR